MKTDCVGPQRLLASPAGEGLGCAVGVTYDWNFWNISMVPGGKNMDCLESFRAKGPGKMAPRAPHPGLERSWGIVFSFHTARPLWHRCGSVIRVTAGI